MARRRSIFTMRDFRKDTSGFNTSNSPSPSGTSRSVRFPETAFNRINGVQQDQKIRSTSASPRSSPDSHRAEGERLALHERAKRTQTQQEIKRSAVSFYL